MTTLEIFKMNDYCTNLKKYFDIYYASEDNVNLYGDKKSQLLDVINNEKLPVVSFYVSIEEIVGEVTRVINGTGSQFPFIDWIGSDSDCFTKDNFISTIKIVWPEFIND